MILMDEQHVKAALASFMLPCALPPMLPHPHQHETHPATSTLPQSQPGRRVRQFISTQEVDRRFAEVLAAGREEMRAALQLMQLRMHNMRRQVIVVVVLSVISDLKHLRSWGNAGWSYFGVCVLVVVM